MKYLPHSKSSYKLVPRLCLPIQVIRSKMLTGAIVEGALDRVKELAIRTTGAPPEEALLDDLKSRIKTDTYLSLN